jgi:hypothetical protein
MNGMRGYGSRLPNGSLAMSVGLPVRSVVSSLQWWPKYPPPSSNAPHHRPSPIAKTIPCIPTHPTSSALKKEAANPAPDCASYSRDQQMQNERTSPGKPTTAHAISARTLSHHHLDRSRRVAHPQRGKPGAVAVGLCRHCFVLQEVDPPSPDVPHARGAA